MKRVARWEAVTAALLCGVALAGCQKSAPSISAAQESAPVEAAPQAKTPEITPLPPAEEKRLTEMAKARRAGDGSSVWDVLEYAEKQRPAQFKIATIDVDYARDSTPKAVSVCYWIGNKRLDADQDCKSIGWQIAPDKGSLAPYQAPATQAVESGREAFVRTIDQMYATACAGGKAC